MYTNACRGLKKNRRPLAAALLALALYAFAAIILTWPLVTAMNKYYFSPETPGDGAGVVADNWYRNHTPPEYRQGGVTTFYAYPFGNDLGDARGYPLETPVRVLLAGLFGEQASFNLVVLFSFPLAGMVMFILVGYLTRSAAASFVGGFICAFSPWHISRTFD